MEIKFEHATIYGDRFFHMINEGRKVGEFYISEFPDCYSISFEPYRDYYLIKQGLDDKLKILFANILAFAAKELDNNLPILLVEDEAIVNRYAIVNNLNRVPRFNGFYLYLC